MTGRFARDAKALEEITKRVAVHPARALVVDDDNVSRTLLVKLLRHLGHEAIPAASAEEALVKFEQEDPDLVLMDVMLPGMDGIEALKLMKKARGERWLPVILVSVKDASNEILLGLRAGAHDYLTKPIVFDQVVAKLRNLTESLALHTQLRSSLRFARAVMEHMLEGLLCIDDGGRVLASNPAAERMFGYRSGELNGKHFEQLSIGSSSDSLRIFSEMGGLSFGTGVRCNESQFQFEAQISSVELDSRQVTVITLRDIDRQLGEERRILNDAAQLREYHAAHEAENELGREMLDRLLYRNASIIPNVSYSTVAATGFSGDVVAARRSPSGKLFVMMADATGHGLAAAISLVPALSVLHGMVGRDYTLSDIVREMNTKLCELTPVDRFLAAVILRFDESKRCGEIWVGGMPAAFLLDEQTGARRRFDSQHAPLGICPSDDELVQTEAFDWPAGAQMVMISDGVIEAESPTGEQFGEERVLTALACDDRQDLLGCVSRALGAHLCGFGARDDASIAVVRLS
ncbi:MAG: SpoIIE family protein phosphatase [Polyangiaceae bacterium]